MARGFGAVSRRYLGVRSDLDPDDVIAQQVAGNGTDATARLGEARYHSSFLFTFRVSYRSVESFDEIHSISLSGLTGHYLSGDHFFSGLNLMETPAAGVADTASVAARDVLGGALEELERQIEVTVNRFVRDSELHLQRERARLQTFFTALIAEEKSRLTRRQRAPGSVGAAERKLEWVNRLEQENRLFAPRVEVDLIGLQEMRTPARPVEFMRGGRRLLEAELDLASGELVGLLCATCSTDLDQIQLCPGEHLTCAECMEECAECAC
jgi:hypothetical protein